MDRLPVCEAWFEIEPIDDTLTRIHEPHAGLLIRANIWLLLGRDRDLLVDTGNGLAPLAPIVQRLRPEREKPLIAVATHAHMDHVCGLHEFEERALHPADATLAQAPDRLLFLDDVWPGTRQQCADIGFPLPELMIEAVPDRGFDPSLFRASGVTPTVAVEEGSVIDLGDRGFEVLHLPGHTRGSIGLWEAESGTLFSGDAVYASEPLLDTTPTSDVAAYLDTMRRLRELPVNVVHAGHDASFGRHRLVEVCDSYIATREPALG